MHAFEGCRRATKNSRPGLDIRPDESVSRSAHGDSLRHHPDEPRRRCQLSRCPFLCALWRRRSPDHDRVVGAGGDVCDSAPRTRPGTTRVPSLALDGDARIGVVGGAGMGQHRARSDLGVCGGLDLDPGDHLGDVHDDVERRRVSLRHPSGQAALPTLCRRRDLRGRGRQPPVRTDGLFLGHRAASPRPGASARGQRRASFIGFEVSSPINRQPMRPRSGPIFGRRWRRCARVGCSCSPRPPPS